MDGAPTRESDTSIDQHRHLTTDHLRKDLKRRTISGGIIRVTAQGIQLCLNLTSIAVLARLLTPADFGLIAMVTTVLGFLQVFKDLGLSTATIQREDITHQQVSNLFWINIGLGAVISLVVMGLAPILAWFYEEPKLVLITMALAGTFFLSGLAVQHMALLNRQMRFHVVSVIEVGSVAVGVGLSIYLAWKGIGFWSLVWGTLATMATRFLAAWTTVRWRPSLPRRGSGALPLVKFGANLTVSGFLHSFSGDVTVC